MFIGKWNKSVILTYIGMGFSLWGMCFALSKDIKNAFLCLVLAAICDLFDGTVARKCKRTEEEKEFGIQLDSLVDVVSFVIFPLVIYMGMGMTHWYDVLVFVLYGICGVARLGFFNISVACSDGPVKYYRGVPVTSAALVFSAVYVFSKFVPTYIVSIAAPIMMTLLAIAFIADIKIKKPTKLWYCIFVVLAIVMIVLMRIL